MPVCRVPGRQGTQGLFAKRFWCQRQDTLQSPRTLFCKTFVDGMHRAGKEICISAAGCSAAWSIRKERRRNHPGPPWGHPKTHFLPCLVPTQGAPHWGPQLASHWQQPAGGQAGALERLRGPRTYVAVDTPGSRGPPLVKLLEFLLFY